MKRQARKFRIGITCYSRLGGSGVVASELGLRLARRGHEVHFITGNLPYRLREYEGNVYFHQVEATQYFVFEHPPWTLSLASKMAEVADTYDLELFHVHYAIPHATCAVLARDMLGRHIPIVTTLHGTDITLVGMEPSYYNLTRYSMKHSDRITSVSNFLRTKTLRSFGRDLDVRVIPNFVDPTRFRPGRGKAARSLLAPNGEAVLMHASNFRPIKNIDVVVEVFARVARQVPCRLVMLGEGPERVEAERLGRKLGVEDSIMFMGSQERIEELLPLADVFLLPSQSEGFGLGALEAMSAGVPVIATSVGGPPEFIQDGVTGHLCRPRDASRMARLCLQLLRHPAAAKAMGRRARASVLKDFHVDKVVSRYEAVYDELFRNPGA